MATLDDLLKISSKLDAEIELAISEINTLLPSIEKQLLRRIDVILKDLDLNNDGTVKTTVKNLRKLNEIEREIENAFESNAKYNKAVANYTKSYDKVTATQTEYFQTAKPDFEQPKIIEEIKAQSIKDVNQYLKGSNIVANVIEPVNKLVLDGVTSGVSYGELRASIGNYLTGTEETVGALSRYTTTITNDSLNTYVRTYEQQVTKEQGYEWFLYTGREMVTTRPFCLALSETNGGYFKRSDISGFLEGDVMGVRVELYKRTGLPSGMKAETTEGNFLQLCGGWNCGHRAMPIPTAIVPKEFLR